MATDTTTQGHSHPTSSIDAAILDLQARVKVLEAGGVAVPPPPPPGRPFPAPVTLRTVQLPPSIAGLTTDASDAVNAWLAANVPDGSIVDFGSAKLVLSQGLQFAKRSNLVFQGHGVAALTALAASDPTSYLASPFCLGHTYKGNWDNANSDIVIDGFNLIGSSPTPGVYGGGEGQHTLCLTGTARLEVLNCVGQKAFGDFLFLNGLTDAWIHDSHALTAGRNGVSVIAGTRMTVERTALDVCGYCTLDVEPNVPADAISSVILRAGTAQRWGVAEFFALDGSNAGAPISGVTVDGWAISGKSLASVVGYQGPQVVKARPKAIAFTNNASQVAGGPFSFAHVDGLRVAANKGAGVALVPTINPDCTGVVLV